VKLQGDMITAARALDAAAASGNAAGLSAARNTLGGTCKSCHDRFRAEL
jgi:cytochrome c556